MFRLWLFGAMVHFNRTLPNSGAEGGQNGGTSVFNLMFIVGLALFITVLARYLSGRGNRKK